MSNDTPSAKANGRVLRGLPFSLDRHNPVSIGSDSGCDIVIDGADPRHAELRWDNNTSSWGIYDDPAPGATLRNGEAIDSARLYEGDVLDIAGVRIRYADRCLAEYTTDARLRVALHHVSATAGGKKRLDDISFTAEPGTFVAILGPSGCGKSTLIQRIAGLAPYEGDILFNGHELRDGKAEILPLLAYLPQSVEDSLHGEMSVYEAMRDFARTHLAANASPDFTARLADVGLDAADIPEKPVHQLSGGQKRRFALALALLRDPQLLLLDEPTAGLDPAAEAGIMELLRRIADQGRTVLCATHVLGSLGLCDEVLVLAPGGRRVFAGTPARAIVHFVGADGWLDIYRRLQKGGSESNSAVTSLAVDAAAEPPRELPPPPGRPPFAGPFGATFRRLFQNLVRGWKQLGLFLGLPLGIAIVLLVTCQSHFKDGDLDTIYFCMVIAMFWLGLSGSVRPLVAERVPKRCLDRMRGVPVRRYLPAHVATVALSALVQSLTFLVPIFAVQVGREFVFDALFPFWLVLALVSFAGGCVGLFVSACCRKELTAVWFLPLIAILALFFSKPVLGEKDTQPLKSLERIMPTFYPQKLLASCMARAKGSNPSAHSDNRLHFAYMALGYPFVFLPLAVLFQNRREEEWDGR